MTVSERIGLSVVPVKYTATKAGGLRGRHNDARWQYVDNDLRGAGFKPRGPAN